MTDTAPAAAATQDAADSAETTEAPQTPAGPETAATDTDSRPGGDEVDDGQDDGDDRGQDDSKQFDHAYVQKLRREAASLRDRAKTAENTVAALQRQTAEQRITAAGMKPEAVWAVAELGDVLDDQGAVATGKLQAAMNTARAQLGIQRATPAPGRGAALQSGSGVPHEKRNNWSAAFGPKPN